MFIERARTLGESRQSTQSIMLELKNEPRARPSETTATARAAKKKGLHGSASFLAASWPTDELECLELKVKVKRPNGGDIVQ